MREGRVRRLPLRYVLGVLCVLFMLASCETAQSPTSSAARRDPLVERAVAALSGVEALRGLRALSVKGTFKHWEPEQSYAPGGEARFAAEGAFDLTLDFATRRARWDWDKKFAYPSPRVYRYTEVVVPDAGYVIGIDSAGRNAQSLKANPPAHTMSGVRLATTQREALRVSPDLLFEMYNNPGRVTPLPNQQAGGVSYPALSFAMANANLIVLFDPQSGMPLRVRTLDYDNMWGDVNFDMVLSDWRTVAGVRVAAHQRYELNGRLVADVQWTQISANPPLNPAGMSVPDAVRSTAATPARGYVPYQWVIRRQFIGTYLDSDNTSYDTQAAEPGLRLNDLAPGVHHVVGGTHNALVADMRDYLIVFDAPVSDWQSNWTIKAAQSRLGVKPVRYLVLTHHHMDHAGGLRAYLAQGATLVVGRGASAHYRRLLAAPTTRNPDVPAQDYSRVNIVEVSDRYVMRDGRREVSAHAMDNPHAESTLIGYVADVRIGFVADVWSPGAAPLPREINPPLAALVNATRRAGISPLRYAGGHGGSAEYPPLAGLAAQKR